MPGARAAPGQMGGLDLVFTGREEGGALEHVAHLPDVTRPRIVG